MFSINKPQYYSFQKGKLIQKQSYSLNLTQFQKNVQYYHTLRYTPDQYHIQAIKQFKKQLDQMRKNYQQLRRAYWYMLGYRIEGDDRIPKVNFNFNLIRQKNNQLCVTQVSECNQRYSSLNVSNAEINQAITDIQQNKKKIDKLDNQLTQSIIQFRQQLLLKPQNHNNNDNDKLTRSAWNTKTKTKTQNDQQIQQHLYYTLKQNQKLKEKLEEMRIVSQTQTRQFKLSYEEHIRKLQQILQRQRKHTKMLNGVINRMRTQIGSKDNFIKSFMKLKSTDKISVDKLIKQFKTTI